MVYRYESDEDAFVEYPEPGSDLSMLGAGPPPPTGPSPSRFPTPSLPRSTRLALPASPPEPPRVRAEVPAPVSPPPQAYSTPPPSQTYGAPPPVEPPHPQTYGAPPPIEPPSQVHAAPPPVEPSPVRRGGGGRLWQVLIGGAAVLVLLALCGLAAAALLADRTPQPQPTPSYQAGANPSAEPDQHPLDSRDTDQAPLTAKELFAGKELVATEGQPAYQVLKTQSSGSCAVAATDEVADLLVRLGCNQVVRATLRSADGTHLVTTGLFNLTDRASAERARDRIRQLLDERQGRFRGMAAGQDSEAIATAPARVGWQVRGHYLAYAVVARTDGETIRSGDTAVREILFDMIELHLNRGVLERRAAGGTASQPTPAPSESTGAQDGTENLPGD
ncbi:hypothetical protein [Micromonospora sp. WMMD812]|uniref:hypothetical protein n=1 Tax=Micromonospora sp. WMMD812 TaxID=3015152 RepID=UPI00248C9B21|nr:hypothetical protein [Micromonospora sp. WMMD812]WBB66397.1 hypothetical protein O7603_25050 [Micromonospora sp. WMMD812]